MKFNEYEIYEAKSFKQRLIGLMFKKNVNYGLIFKNCRSIHTMFMKFNLDVLLINESKIIDLKRNVSPNKIIIFKHKKTSIIELPYNPSLNYQVNDFIDLRQ